MANKAFLDGNKCWGCKWMGTIPGSSHNCCKHPVTESSDNTFLRLLATLGSVRRIEPFHFTFKELNLNVNPYGVRKGWFFFPFNFDPTWLDSCDGWEEGISDKEHIDDG